MDEHVLLLLLACFFLLEMQMQIVAKPGGACGVFQDRKKVSKERETKNLLLRCQHHTPSPM